MLHYILGLCTRQSDTGTALAGEDSSPTTRGMFLVTTNSESPYAKGPNHESPRELTSLRQRPESDEFGVESFTNDNEFLESSADSRRRFIPEVEIIKN